MTGLYSTPKNYSRTAASAPVERKVTREKKSLQSTAPLPIFTGRATEMFHHASYTIGNRLTRTWNNIGGAAYPAMRREGNNTGVQAG